jgi:hypothetical protein
MSRFTLRSRHFMITASFWSMLLLCGFQFRLLGVCTGIYTDGKPLVTIRSTVVHFAPEDDVCLLSFGVFSR